MFRKLVLVIGIISAIILGINGIYGLYILLNNGKISDMWVIVPGLIATLCFSYYHNTKEKNKKEDERLL